MIQSISFGFVKFPYYKIIDEVKKFLKVDKHSRLVSDIINEMSKGHSALEIIYGAGLLHTNEFNYNDCKKIILGNLEEGLSTAIGDIKIIKYDNCEECGKYCRNTDDFYGECNKCEDKSE